MVERHSIWASPYSDTYIGSQHHSNRDRDADSICDSDVNSYSEPGAVFHADIDRDIDTFAEPGTHVHPNGDGDTDTV